MLSSLRLTSATLRERGLINNRLKETRWLSAAEARLSPFDYAQEARCFQSLERNPLAERLVLSDSRSKPKPSPSPTQNTFPHRLLIFYTLFSP